MTTVLVTGISGRLAGLVAGLLASQAGVTVVGVDRTLPPAAPPGVTMRTVSFQGAALRDLLDASAVQAVVHLAQAGEERPVRDREAAVRANVLATIDLLGACVAAGVRRVVLRSSTLVYGANPDQPLFLNETAPLRVSGRGHIIQDYVETERFAADFAERHPGLAIAVLRCAPLVGGELSSPLARYLSSPYPRTLLGFDPLLQVLHPDDAAVALAMATLADLRGAFNLAADSPIKLAQAIRLSGSQPLPLPIPLFDTAQVLGGYAAPLLGPLAYDPVFLRYPCIADTRRAQTELRFAPQHSAEDALRSLQSARPEPAPAGI